VGGGVGREKKVLLILPRGRRGRKRGSTLFLLLWVERKGSGEKKRWRAPFFFREGEGKKCYWLPSPERKERPRKRKKDGP